ncbi:hypothetical protein QKW35_16660 [Pontibacterium granulatum]|uniref:hypothetical protein n=1 Tax=Pontibacterium granulatum TaxID=2036029 RepID=UPI00249A92DE|nr:hypothetical protein [Pontibacterium granulatum]MDI3326013.1 hypothetical protein [Pontibacterium granulatum]
MKRRQTKAEIRAELERQVQSFIDKGGEIQQVEMGESGLEDGKYDPRRFGFESSVQSRTPLNGLLATIDSRRKSPKPDASMKKVRTQPRQKVIYDDFGEPLRKVWVDE